MTELTIDRLVTRAEVRGAEDEARVRRLVADLTGRELERALASAQVPDGLWCIRRLDVHLRLDGRGDRDLGRDWARTVVDTLLQGLSPEGGVSPPGVVGYARPEQMLTDLVTELARGRTERAWAWRTLGAVAAGDPDPDTDARGAVLAALARRPQTLVPVLADAVSRAGFARVHRLLGADGWQSLAELALATAGQSAEAWLSDPVPAPRATGGQPVAGVVADRSRIARSWRASGVRPGPQATRALALLAIAEAEPALLRRPDAGLLDAVAVAVDPRPRSERPGLVVSLDSLDSLDAAATASTQGGADRVVPDGAGSSPASREGQTTDHSTAVGAATAARAEPAEPPPSESAAARRDTSRPDPTGSDHGALGEATQFGGAVYLLATAEAAGLPDALLADRVLGLVPPSTVLHRLLVMITGADPQDDDPALRALAGLGREAAVAPGTDVRDALAPHVDRWRQVTAARLGDDDPPEVIRALVRRRGRVVVEPGWVEFHLRLGEVDLGVRRAGLDLDPGFVPWLGSVVVIRYA